VVGHLSPRARRDPIALAPLEPTQQGAGEPSQDRQAFAPTIPPTILPRATQVIDQRGLDTRRPALESTPGPGGTVSA
jgi:hypothetical protein